MKNALKKWYSYLIAVGLCGIAATVAMVPYFSLEDKTVWPRVYISYVLLFAGVVFAGIGFIVQDIFRAFRRKATKNWDYPLEQKDINRAWLIYLPCLLSGLICFIAGLISYLFLR